MRSIRRIVPGFARRTLATVTLAAGAILAGACDSPQDVAPQAIASGESLVATLEDGKPRIDRVLESLNVLRYGAPAERPQDFQAFREALTALSATAEEARDEGARMRALGDDYFARWTEVTARSTPEERRAAAPERVMADDRYQAILDSMTQLRRSYDAFETSLLEIEQSLPGNLTDAGLAGLDPTLSRLGLQAADVKNVINRLVEQIDSAVRRLA